MKGPVEALKEAIRKAMLEHESIAGLTIAGDELMAGDPLPGAEIGIHGSVPTYTMGPSEAYRDTKFSVVWFAEDKGGVSALADADGPNEATRVQLYENVSNESAQERLNRFLEPLGYSAGIPLETGYIPQHSKRFGKDKTAVRWGVGYWFEVQINRN